MGAAGSITTLSGFSNLLGVGLGFLIIEVVEAPTTHIVPSESVAADVAISLFVLPNRRFQSGAPVLEKVEIKPSLPPLKDPAIQDDVLASVVPIKDMDIGVNNKSLTCSFPE
ncbi:unannotated protein [freshwater metagenome]|uniref:Unannotated protein n=1 Tax=freshwater metagenome TaxID=449393 RepID=A0A6J6LG23_9ZZZZ